MNLQERLEVMLDERRTYVISEGPLTEEKAERLLANLADWARCAGDPKEPARDAWLVRVAGAALYLMHPEDEAKVGTTAHPALPSQAVAHAFTGLYSDEHDVPLVVKRGDGTYKRKPRPDVG